MAPQNQNQNDLPIWEFVRSMDNLGINPETRPSIPTGGAQEGINMRHFPNSGPPPAPEGMNNDRDRDHHDMGGPSGGRGPHHHGRRHHNGGMGWRGSMGPFENLQGPFTSFGGPGGQWPFTGPPRGPGHRGRHHGRRHHSRTPSSSGSSRSRSHSRARSVSPHAEGSRAERAGTAGETFNFGQPSGPPPHPHPHPYTKYHHSGGRRGRPGPFFRGPPPPPFDINALISTLTSHPLAQNIWQNFIPTGTQTNFDETNNRNTTNPFTDAAKDSTSFTPPLDLFTTPTSYTIHISLPGAKKEDIGINFSSTTSTLTVSGVVYKPGSEEFLATLTSSERHDSGMFERSIVLRGNEKDGGAVDSDGISAKLEDGILIVTVPRVEKEWEDIKTVEIE